MEEILDFLIALNSNNNREWFNAHKDEYIHVKSKFDKFVELLIEKVRGFDDTIGPLSVGDCTWRIYRDTRFSHDKRPYKTQMSCFIAPGGKKGAFSGYYFQVGISDKDGTPQGIVATGNYYTEPNVLRILREDIAFDNAKDFEKTLELASGFKLSDDQMLKRMPRGYDDNMPYSKYYLYKNFCLTKEVGEDYMLSDNFLDNLVGDLKTTEPFLSFINRAVKYSIEAD